MIVKRASLFALIFGAMIFFVAGIIAGAGIVGLIRGGVDVCVVSAILGPCSFMALIVWRLRNAREDFDFARLSRWGWLCVSMAMFAIGVGAALWMAFTT